MVIASSPGDAPALLELVRHDSDLFVHGLKVGKLAERIAVALGLADGYATRIRLAGELHDIGKLAIPRSVLTKPGALSDRERRAIERHPIVGAAILQLAGLPRQARWVRHHHERMDGRGYPDGLAAHEIPLPSRIILAADAFDALTSDRPYRRAQSRDEALAELAAHCGSQFDPACIAALIEVAEQVIKTL
jgi:HD-GYP domain-containing protein (c-di-GMP phosphodiesterase class II)